jgi:hypothetical protein|tara:strand:- start:713 stop:988 length:276 start_codon:yes stop_codon:yes gene_type:complete
VLSYYKDQGKTNLSIQKLDAVMRNYGMAQFDYEVFKSAYDNEPRLQELVNNFNQDEIDLSDKSASDELDPSDDGDDTSSVSTMAKRATDLD